MDGLNRFLNAMAPWRINIYENVVMVMDCSIPVGLGRRRPFPLDMVVVLCEVVNKALVYMKWKKWVRCLKHHHIFSLCLLMYNYDMDG